MLITTTDVVPVKKFVRGENMIGSDAIRGYNDTFILTVLHEGDSYGYAISKRINEIAKNNYTIKETTLYSAFNRLEKKGYIQSFPGEITHGKKRTYYTITVAGKEYLADKIAEWRLTKKVVGQFIKEEENERS